VSTTEQPQKVRGKHYDRNILKKEGKSMDKILIAFAAAIAIGLPAIATAWAQSKIGSAGAGSLAEKPELSGTIIILVAIPETMVILGFVVAVIILLGG
jgi:V/A-type H+-transporting ATPase subunit K